MTAQPRLFLALRCAVLLFALTLPWAATAEELPAAGDLCILPALQDALAHHRKLAETGGWPAVPPGSALREGMRDERIPLLRSRLAASADLAPDAPTADALFDSVLAEAVRRFQKRHGLHDDGVVGVKTLAALNVPISERLRQLTVNLQRCQPLPERLAQRHLLVNIADFTLTLYENGNPILDMPVIVGRTYRQTPVFNGVISSLVLNPAWEVPHSIAIKDILPKARKNPAYLPQHNFQIFQGWDRKAPEIDPATIDWSRLGPGNFPYRLRQRPGPDNALGRLKFLFPNKYDVYLHDTPARELFRKEARTFSSGCIRVADPLALAVALLRDSPLAGPEALNEALATGKTRQISLPHPIDVHIVYMTAWVDRGGILQFRSDIYHRDMMPDNETGIPAAALPRANPPGQPVQPDAAARSDK
ncbi:L,D-transpeptidase family protein [Thiovibrio sp. JS02]